MRAERQPARKAGAARDPRRALPSACASERLETLAETRADAMLEDHRRVREAARDVGQ